MQLSFIIMMSILVATTMGQVSCTQRWQCQSVTNDYNYVDCVSGNCACLRNQGFIGNATLTSKCTCPSGNKVYWENGLPYCQNIALATQLQIKDARATILENQVRRVYNSLIYPTPLFILNRSISLDDLFDTAAKGRIDPVGEFDDRTILIEYYYVFALSEGARVTSVDFVYLFAKGNEVFVRVNILFSIEVAPGLFFPAINATQLGSYVFNDKNLIASTDLAIPNIGILAPIFNRTARNVQFCNDMMNNCPAIHDPEGYYTSFDDCFSFIRNESLVRLKTLDGSAFVTYNEPVGNTDVCRWFHSILAKEDKIHCKHSGKTGFKKCVDESPVPYYLTYYQKKY